MNILVVDDTEQGRYMLEAFLKAKGHEVTGAVFHEQIQGFQFAGLPALHLDREDHVPERKKEVGFQNPNGEARTGP